jgi:transglutaminase-like putative cysteine protease
MPLNLPRSTQQILWHLLFFGLTLRAAVAGLPPLSPEDQSFTSVPQQPGAPAVTLYREETDDDTLHFHSVDMRIKVLTEAGRKYADVELPYNRREFKIAAIGGRTVHADGSVVPFQGKPFDKVVVKGHNLRFQVKTFTLPDVQVGSILEFHYTLHYSDNSVVAPQWIVQDELFQKRAAFKFIPYRTRSNTEVELAHGQIARGIAWTPYIPNKQPELHTRADGVEWVDLAVADVPAFVEEPFMPPPDILKWRVSFYYRADLNANDYWKNEGKFWNKDVENFLGRKKGISDAVGQTVAAGDSPEAKVRKIYAFVSQLENRSYDPHRATQEEQALGIKRNQGVEDVLRQRSGDHDELNRLLVAMVREAGIAASLIWIPDRSRTYFDKNYLSADQFDAEIAIVQLDSKDVFLDPGSKFCPYGLLNWRYSDAQGLRGTGKGTEVSQTTHINYTQAVIKRVARVKLSAKGTAEGRIGVGFFGLEAMARRREGGHTDAEGRKKLLEDEMKGWLPGGSEVTLASTPDWDKTESPLVAEFKVTTPMAVSAGKRWMVPAHLFQVNQKAEFAPAQRVNAVYFDYPSREVDEVHITLPPEVEVESLPGNDNVRLEYALYYTENKREAANSIVSIRDLQMAANLFKADEYKEVKGFYDKVKQGDDQPVILKASTHAANNGN